MIIIIIIFCRSRKMNSHKSERFETKDRCRMVFQSAECSCSQLHMQTDYIMLFTLAREVP
jgi:hypothetical protein